MFHVNPHRKYQVLFSLKKKISRLSSTEVVIGALRVHISMA